MKGLTFEEQLEKQVEIINNFMQRAKDDDPMTKKEFMALYDIVGHSLDIIQDRLTKLDGNHWGI